LRLFKTREERAAAKLRKHQAAFVCHVCGAPSLGPLHVEGRTPQYNADGQMVGSVISRLDKVQWRTPKSLERCDTCRQWACIETMTGRQCLVHGTCARCRATRGGSA